MVSPVDRVYNGLQKLKQISEGPATLEERDKLVKQLKGDLCFLQNIPPCYKPDMRECVLASKFEYI